MADGKKEEAPEEEPQDIDNLIESTLDKVRPFLNREGGDVEYYGFKDGVVYLSLSGACAGCMYAAEENLTAGIEIILIEEVPGVVQVDATGYVPPDVMDRYLAKKERQEAEKAK